MLIKYAASKGIETANIVRRTEQVTLLKSIGAKIVINSSDDDWEKQLASVLAEFGPTAFYDAIGGEITGKTLSCLPAGSIHLMYGLLSGKKDSTINVDELMSLNKQVRGYQLIGWQMTKTK